MLKVEESSGGVGGAWAPTLCESCRSAPCTIYCRADAAALCAACDANIHSANLLARRHQRVPILPALAGAGGAGLVVRPSLNLPYHIGVPVDGAERGGVGVETEKDQEEEDDDEAAASWMLLNTLKGHSIQSCHSLLFGDEGDEFLDLGDYNNDTNNNTSSENQSAEDCDGRKDEDAQRGRGGRSDVGSEFLVPNEQHSQQHHKGYHMMDQFEGSHGFSYSSSLNHSEKNASFSSMDANLVSDATCMGDILNADQYVRPSKGTIDLFSGHPLLQVPSGQFDPMDREARVLRYREKRKSRKFEKTIRYASRKAYAETRPRIKGRFAKRSDMEVEVDQMFSTSVRAGSAYGIVPSF